MNNSVYHAWFAQHFLSSDRRPLLDDAQLAAVQAEAIRQCDSLDGSTDGVIGEPTKCHPKLDMLACAATSQIPCLTSAQIEAVLAIYVGPRDARGHPIYYGVAPGSEYSWSRSISNSVEFATNFTSYMTGPRGAVPQDIWKIDYAPASLKRYDHLAAELNALDPNLAPFQTGGGKILVWHGSADSSIPPGSTIDYVASVRQRMGAKNVDKFMRFYLVPGMAHCTAVAPGPTGVNFLDPLMRWVEDGVTPDAVPAWGAPNTHDWNLQPYFK